MLAPDALLDDGQLDVLIVSAASKLKLIRALSTAYDGGHRNNPLCTFRRCREVVIEPLGGGHILIDVDGESPGRAPMRVEVLPGALTLRA